MMKLPVNIPVVRKVFRSRYNKDRESSEKCINFITYRTVIIFLIRVHGTILLDC